MLQGPLSHALLREAYSCPIGGVNQSLPFLCFHSTFENNPFVIILCLV